MLHILPSMLTTTVFGAETALETASLQQAKGHLQASPIELFGRDAGPLNGRRYVCLAMLFEMLDCDNPGQNVA